MELKRYNLWIGPPLATSIYGPTYTGSYGHYQAVMNPLSYPNGFSWRMDSDSSYDYNLYSDFDEAWVDFYNPGYFYLFVKAKNTCGWSLFETYTYITSTGAEAPYISYPNPVSDILNIKIDDTTVQQSITGASPLKNTSAPAYDVHLYDGQGNLLRNAKIKDGTVQFNVSNLPDGIYYLHIYDGVNKAPDIQQIVVEH